MTFKALGLTPYILRSTVKQNYTEPTAIQEQAIPTILQGKDVLGIAPTGSGKTAAYVLPIIQNLERLTTTKNRHINVLVLVPTRELAVQVEEVFRSFSEELPFRLKSMAVHGGVSINPQMMGMQHLNILVATPGRLLELKESNAMHFESLSTLILDEADKMLNLGFKDEMDRIFALLPKRRQNLLFSATLSPEVEAIERVLLNNPTVVKVEAKPVDIELINQVAYGVSLEKKGPLLRHLIKSNEMKQVLVFTSSTYQADVVAEKLNKNGVDAKAIHSKKSQGSRKDSLTKFTNGKLRVLVSTDLLARGIDIAFLPHVINYELPRSPKDFVHRIGRTGRAENPGEAITFVTEEDTHHFGVIQKKMKRKVVTIDSRTLDFR
ncbi:DEAD/DEAH box helicase [Bacteroidia bacterium]|jgi:ATP-dependent RNA helicase RhlE|nr:DEAD/DEAH box helicase [Bacteroidia bacterium]